MINYSELQKQQNIAPSSTAAPVLPSDTADYRVPHASLAGGIPGLNHNKRASEIIVVDMETGNNFPVKLENLTDKQISDTASKYIGTQSGADADLCDKVYSTFEALAKEANMTTPETASDENPVEVQDAPNVTDYPVAIKREEMAAGKLTHMPAPVTEASAGISSTSNAKPHENRQSLFNHITDTQHTRNKPAEADVRPPSYKVTFEIEGAPMVLETWYHQIIRNEHVLALCYDTRCVGYPRSRLRPTSNDIAIHVEGSDSIYVVTDPAISFIHNNDEIQIFLIKSEYPYERTS